MVDNVLIVKNGMHEAILTAMEKVIIPRIEMPVKSITGSLRHGLQSVVKNPDRGVFTGNNKNFPLKSASRQLELNID